MNEKIKELKKQATIRIDSHGAFGEPESYEKLDIDKFIELLLKEAEAKYYSEGYQAGINEGIRDCINHFAEHGDIVSAGNLQTHFGIEL